MFDNFLNALDDYIEMKQEYDREIDKRGDSRRWYEQMRECRRKIVCRMQGALDAYIQDRTGINHLTLP
jgi:hypothetical protein